MLNARVPAAAEGMSKLTRREALRALAAGGATGALTASVVSAATSAAAAEAADLAAVIEAELQTYVALYAEQDRIIALRNAAYDAMPEWVRVGPSELYSDGSKGGSTVGWPECADLSPPESGRTTIIRQGPRDYWKRRRALLTTGGVFNKHEDGSISLSPIVSVPAADRRAIRLETIAGMRRLIARIREARAVKDAAGLARMDRATDAVGGEIDAVQERVLSLATGCSIAELGVVALFSHRWEETDFTIRTMRQLLPQLEGTLRALTQAEIADYDRRNGEA